MSWSPRQFETWFEASFRVGTALLHGSRPADIDPRIHCGPGGGSTASRQPVAIDVLAHPNTATARKARSAATGHEDLMKPVGFPIFFSSDLDTLELVGLTTE